MKELSISYSELQQFAKSPAHLLAYRQRELKATPAMIYGRAAHAVILNQPMDGFAVEKVDRRTNAGKERAAEIEAAGIDLISPEDYGEMVAMREVFNSLTATWPRFDAEQPFICRYRGLEIRGRRDIQTADFVADLKIVRDASPRAVRNLCLYEGLAMQAAIYTLEWDHFKPYYIVAIEKETMVGGIYRISADTMRAGVVKLEYLVDRYMDWELAGQPITGYNFWEDEV